MMTTQQNTKLYKVIYENMKTGTQHTEIVEANSTYEARDKVMGKLSETLYDVLMVISARKADLQ